MAIRLLVLVGLLITVPSSFGQICKLQYGGVNAARWITGTVQTECGFNGKFGNWGVTSNVGWISNGDQFQGWYPADGHEQWMSCTNHSSTQPPNPNYYNATGYTEQNTDKGNNSHGGGWDSIGVSCPVDSDGDGSCDSGGCMDVSSYTLSNNWMSMYELDHGWGDDFVTTLNFPNVSVTMTCDVWGCDDMGSAWVAPSSSTAPGTGVDARLALAVINIFFIYSGNTCEDLAELDERYDCD